MSAIAGAIMGRASRARWSRRLGVIVGIIVRRWLVDGEGTRSCFRQKWWMGSRNIGGGGIIAEMRVISSLTVGFIRVKRLVHHDTERDCPNADLQTCHPHSIVPLPCPYSPSKITVCPCGATPLQDLPNYPRPDCLAPVPTCGQRCPKERPCGHTCPRSCHEGPCPPCHEEVVRPCRCGESQLVVGCDELRERKEQGLGELTCERVCKALRK
jgi:hypothetical protein